MASFDLAQYETVDQRLARLHADPRFADVRVVTFNRTTEMDRAAATWVVECRIYLNREDQLHDLPLATGWAFEVDGQGMANKTSALENAETSSRGRAMQALAMSGAKSGPSRTEMEKVQRGLTPKAPVKDFVRMASDAAFNGDLPLVRKLYAEAVAAQADPSVIEKVKELGIRSSKKTGSVGQSEGNPAVS
jgi:hypothetical protein